MAVSVDAGATWRELDRALPRRDYNRVGHRVVVGKSGNGVFWTGLERR